MKIVFNESHRLHEPKHFLVRGTIAASPETPARAAALLAAAKDAGHELLPWEEDAGLAPVAAVHGPEYLQFLAQAHDRWSRIEGAAEEIVPNVHPDRRDGSYPASVVGQAGYHMADTACPIGAGTWQAARAAANLALRAASLVSAGAPAAYALCRPPGHHAFADMAGGFCFLNNAAIAAQSLRGEARRVAILDVDLHHGNGTQGIFYGRDDVLTLSLHADPTVFYPFFWGHADERGKGPGVGYNLNLPLPLGSDDQAFLAALDLAFARLTAFAPDVLVVALGLDAHEDDPLAGLAVTTEGFKRIGAAISRRGLPSVLIQEGGYLTPALGANLAAFLDGFENN